MRIQFITDRLAIGGAINDVSAFEYVRQKGITHIIDLDRICDIHHAHDAGCHRGEGMIEVFHYYLPDDGLSKPFRYFALPVLFVMEVLQEKKNKLLIHCQAGINRSVSIAYAILRCMNISEIEAEKLILTRYFEPLMERDSNFKPGDLVMPGEEFRPGRKRIVQYKADVEEWLLYLKALTRAYWEGGKYEFTNDRSGLMVKRRIYKNANL